MQSFTDIWQYMPHGMCLLWQPWLVLLWAGSDALIFLSYMAIPFALLTVLRKRNDIPFSGLVFLFACFILLCGVTHLLGIVTLWYPIYPWVGLVKLATGLVSATTAVVLFRLIPTLVALPSPKQMKDTNTRLLAEIAAHEQTLASLEDEVEKRTEDLRVANGKLAIQTREAVHRSANLLSVVTSLTRQTARGHEHTDEFVDTLLGRIRSLALATSTVMRGDDEHAGDLEAVVRQQIEPVLMAYGDQVSIEGPSTEIVSEAAQQIALAVHELATNAQKYSLEQDSDSQVAIGWHVEGVGDKQRFTFIWREQLAPDHTLSELERAKGGFGTTLLTRIIPQVLRGSATRSLEQGRLEYRLEVPASAVLAHPHDEEAGSLAARLIDETFGYD